jgi:8-oxo-dGTP pyrophosphatase MutT (NUDIX family)
VTATSAVPTKRPQLLLSVSEITGVQSRNRVAAAGPLCRATYDSIIEREGAAGVVGRASVRVMVLDLDGRLLLLHTCDPARRWFEWWELPGGGIEPREAPRDAAVRELYEETGIRAAGLGRPLGTVETQFSFGGCEYRQTEEVFVLFVAQPAVAPAALDGELEREARLGHRWWVPAEAFAADINLYPPQLADLYSQAASSASIAGRRR